MLNSLKFYQNLKKFNHCSRYNCDFYLDRNNIFLKYIYKFTTQICNYSVNNNEKKSKIKHDLGNGPDLADFIISNTNKMNLPTKNKNTMEIHPYLKNEYYGNDQQVYLDIYGCQMNVNDSEVIWSILQKFGYRRTKIIEDADVILVVTCSIRDGAEEKIWKRLSQLNGLKEKRKYYRSKIPVKIGLLGCMAERLKEKVIEIYKDIDLIAGPDSYRDLPRLLSTLENGQTAINVTLSYDETYADITPVRLNPDCVSAYVTIMRGCDNMCSYCIVPFVRGREKSRPIFSILDEIRHLSDLGVKEVTLLGQNVNSYRDLTEFNNLPKNPTNLAKGFKTVYKNKIGGLRFSDLLDKASMINTEMRIRFTSPHPKDFPDEVLHLIASRANICKQIHLPAQSGNSNVLERMRRGYTRDSYLELVEHIRSIIPEIKLSSDFIAGFCGETEEEFQDTLSLIEGVKYHNAYLFQYSMREKTTAHRKLQDDVRPEIKLQRLQNMASLFRSQAEKLNRQLIGTQQLVLVEKFSRRSKEAFQGRTDGNIRVIIPILTASETSANVHNVIQKSIKPGDYIVVQICNANSNTLTGIPLHHSSLNQYVSCINKNNL